MLKKKKEESPVGCSGDIEKAKNDKDNLIGKKRQLLKEVKNK